ncbi:NADPH oxidase [Histoplasma capsulatum]|uniref:NADPH oxidase n=1 Tax=Ajellomyces capsulatus TaxID=5037 RepID=A0A8A1M2Q4_AJECA|nr:NADPH oxidase [Histoplasma capsulatum]
MGEPSISSSVSCEKSVDAIRRISRRSSSIQITFAKFKSKRRTQKRGLDSISSYVVRRYLSGNITHSLSRVLPRRTLSQYTSVVWVISLKLSQNVSAAILKSAAERNPKRASRQSWALAQRPRTTM